MRISLTMLLALFVGSAQALPTNYLGPLVDPQPIAEQRIPFVPPTLSSEHFIGTPMGPTSPIVAGDPL